MRFRRLSGAARRLSDFIAGSILKVITIGLKLLRLSIHHCSGTAYT